MLDAYIIEKIRREREIEDLGVPIRIEVPWDPRPAEEAEKDDDDGGVSDRGVTIIDYSV